MEALGPARAHQETLEQTNWGECQALFDGHNPLEKSNMAPSWARFVGATVLGMNHFPLVMSLASNMQYEVS